MKNYPALLVDVDEVLFPFAFSYRDWLLSEHGITVDYKKKRYEDLVHGYDWHETLVTLFMNSDSHQGTPVIEEASEAMTLLSNKYRLIICTARGREVQGEGTALWLKEWVPQADVCMHTRRYVDDPLTVTKGEIASHFHAVGLIDDTRSHVESVLEGCEPFLLSRPDGLPSDEGAMGWEIILSRLL